MGPPSVASCRTRCDTRRFALGLACVVITTLIALLSPWILKYAVDDLHQGVTRAKLGCTRRCSSDRSHRGFFRFLMRQIIIGASRDIEYDFANDFFKTLQACRSRTSTRGGPAT